MEITLLFVFLLFGATVRAQGLGLMPEGTAAQNQAIRQWWALLQYRTSGAGFDSKIVNGSFFVSDEGRTHPQKELLATLELFQKVLPASDEHPQCRFPARYRVLREAFDLAPPVLCPKLESWRKDNPISGVAVLFASQYLSNPASIFGHSFLMLESRKSPSYLQVTWNFAAEIPADIGTFTYAFDGLTGHFRGLFSALPYFNRLQVYNNIEDRGIWLYELNFRDDEIQLLSDYMLELNQRAQFQYFFLNENCAEVIWSVLLAVKDPPSQDTNFHLYYSPMELMKDIRRKAWVAREDFLPSLTEQLLAKLRSLNSAQLAEFRAMKTQARMPEKRPDPLVLEATLDHLNILRKQNAGELSVSAQQFENDLLLARSRSPEVPPFEFPIGEKPAEVGKSHSPMKLKVGPAWNQGQPEQFLEYRPGYHAFIDRDDGFQENSSLDFVSIQVRRDSESQLHLQTLRLLELQNFRALNPYQSPISWRVGVSNHLNLLASPGARLTDAFGDVGSLVQISKNAQGYALFRGEARAGDLNPLGRLGLGPSLGFIFKGAGWKVISEGRDTWQVSGNRISQLLEWENQVRIDVSAAWSIEGTHAVLQSSGGEYLNQDIQLALDYYF